MERKVEGGTLASRVGRGRASVPDVPESERLELYVEPIWRRRTTKIAVLVGISLLVLIGAAYAYERSTASHFFPGSRIGGVPVGSRSTSEAEALLHERFVAPLHEPVELTAPQFTRNITPWNMGMRIDVADAARKALGSQQDQPFLTRVWHRIAGDRGEMKLRPEVDERHFNRFVGWIVKKIHQDPENARLDITNNKFNIIPHKLGRKLDRDRAESAILGALTDRNARVEIPVNVIEPELTTGDFNRVIVVNTNTNRLALYLGGEVAKKYDVATGTGGYPTPHGQFTITAKRKNPAWYNPYSDWSRDMPAVIPPGPNNPLGTRALNLSASGIRIHGTPDAGSIGSNASHGCIRMLMPDAEDLFERVEVGTPVLII